MPGVMSSATSPCGKHSKLIVITIPEITKNYHDHFGIGDHDHFGTLITIIPNRDHDRPESLITMPRNTHLLLQKQAVPCAKTVPESDVFMLLGLALSEKKVPQITENTEKPEE